MRNVFRIDAIEAGKAHIFLLDAGDRLCKPFQGKVVQGICADHGADLFGRILRCDQLLSFRGIDAEEARILDWRRADTELDLLGACVPQKVNDDAARRAADDGVIDQYDAFPFDIHADRVQLHADSAFTLFLPRLDEGTAHVLILEQPFYEGDAGSSGIAKSSDIAGVRDAHDDVSVETAFFPELPAHIEASLINVLSIHDGVRAGKIDVFKRADAMLMSIDRAVHGGTDAIVIDGNDFTRKDVTDEFGIDGIQRRRLRSQDPARFGLAEDERAIAEGIAAAIERLIRAGDDRICAVDLIHQFFEFFFFGRTAASCQQFNDDFRIHRSREGRTFQKEAAAKIQCIHQIAIMRECHGATDAVCLQRLDIRRDGRAGRGIAHMADADVPFLFRQVAEYFRYKSHAAEGLHFLAVSDGDTGTFLPAVLQGKDTIVHFMHRRQIMVENAEDAALFMGFVIINFCTFVHSGILLYI